jgi:spore coat polysaccharide biosynthesis predicted glycosyltransferase SpsG
MIKEPVIDLFCDGNHQIGYGHIRRSLALGARLQENGFLVNYIGLSEEANKLLPDATAKGSSVISIFDSITTSQDKVEQEKRAGKVTIALDWFGKEPTPDINIGVFKHHTNKTAKREFFGFEYTIIRDDILKLKSSEHSLNDQVVVCLGGGDLLQQSHTVASSLVRKGYKVVLVQGPLARNIELSSEYEVLINPKNFPEILNLSSWAVTNGGGCLFEAMYLGKPVFVLPQTAEEVSVAQHVYSMKAVLGLGFNNLDLVHTDSKIVCANAQKMIDGKGLDRICSLIQDAYEQL